MRFTSKIFKIKSYMPGRLSGSGARVGNDRGLDATDMSDGPMIFTCAQSKRQKVYLIIKFSLKFSTRSH